MSEAEIKAGLRSLDLAHPFSKAVFAVMDNLEHTARSACVLPNLSNEQRQYNAGMLAAVMDVADQLRSAIEFSRNEHTDTKDEDAS